MVLVSKRWTQTARRVAAAVLVVWGLAAGACKSTQGQSIETEPPIEADNADAQHRFDEAMDLLEDGQYQQAGQAFRLVQAEFGGDPIAALAELYVARSAMGSIDLSRSFLPDATSNYQPAPAANNLASLAKSDDVDKRIRYAAKAYYGVEMALRGQRGQALESLKDYPSAALSNAVLAEDRLVVQSLVAESLFQAGRDGVALEAAARLYAELDHARPTNGRSPDVRSADVRSADATQTDGSIGAGQGDPTAHPAPDGDDVYASLAALARSHAFAAAGGVDIVALQDGLGDELALVRAAAGWGLVSRQLKDGVDDDQRAAVEDLFNRIAPDLVAVGAATRAAELSKRLAALGGPTRLAIGCLLPLTGPHRAVGQRAMAGALVAMHALHHRGQPEVTLVFEDSEGEPDAVFGRLERQHVLAVVGPLDVDRARRFAPMARTREIPMIALTTADAQFERARRSDTAKGRAGSDGTGSDTAAAEDPSSGRQGESAGRFVFRNFIDAAAEARAAARTAFEHIGDRKAAVVYPRVGYGRVTSEAFRGEFRRLGGQIVADLSYDRSKSDFSEVAAKLADANPQTVFVPDSAEKVAEVSAFFANENIWGIAAQDTPSKRSERIQVHYVGTSLWAHPILARQAASYVAGAAIPVWFSTAFGEPGVQRFTRRFQAVYGRAPNTIEAFSFDTIGWLRRLMVQRGMSRPAAIRDALVGGRSYTGVTGKVTMGADGQPRRQLRFVTPTKQGFEALPFQVDTAAGGADSRRSAGAGDPSAHQPAAHQPATQQPTN